ncbi:MAG: holo-ACP synthase [Chlorobiaceae bacterium]|jgi:holo-[acyl-carrier protein] synthase|nr:holo-ACP synthase [Chlorobiaceae bacterium]
MIQPGQYDIGIDMVNVDRIRSSYERYGEQFLGKILTPAEISLCRQKADMIQSAAARFAAKEAISKAIGHGISEHFSWHSVEILNDQHGKPFVRILDHEFPVQEQSIRLSLSHDSQYASAVALIIP